MPKLMLHDCLRKIVRWHAKGSVRVTWVCEAQLREFRIRRVFSAVLLQTEKPNRGMTTEPYLVQCLSDIMTITLSEIGWLGCALAGQFAWPHWGQECSNVTIHKLQFPDNPARCCFLSPDRIPSEPLPWSGASVQGKETHLCLYQHLNYVYLSRTCIVLSSVDFWVGRNRVTGEGKHARALRPSCI